ncbi:MAG: L-rhamnose isomerase [Clostridiales bacterium]|jgi:L-rhamnose isomerase|nr:L-rhamnose isomerase [Clostridiales bacterium]
MYNEAKEAYKAVGVDAEQAIEKCGRIPVSLHCWQGDDVSGFENANAALSGGIQATGNYPGKARSFAELTADLDVAYSLIPGAKRLNLHAIYAVGENIGRDKIEFKHFKPWFDYAEKRGIKIDFNPTLFSHPMHKDGMTLSHPDKAVRDFWVRHVKACRKIAAETGKAQGSPCLHNIWIPDGLKDIPADRLTPRIRLRESLDEIFSVKYDKRYIVDAVESKVFGIGMESYTAGSSEFYLSYAATRGINALLDNGHFHPTESTADKIPSLLAFFDKVALHVTRPVRWDSDHVVLFEDEVKEIAKEIIANGAEERVLIGLDYFDASVNRIAAWAIGARNMQKALLYALLTPHAELKRLQDERKFTALTATREELKTLPFGDVWNEYLRRQSVPGSEWLGVVEDYENRVLSARK